MKALFQKVFYKLFNRAGLFSSVHTVLLIARGLKSQTFPLHRTIWIEWPHRVEIGAKCELEPRLSFKIPAAWRNEIAIKIGERNFIGRNVEFNIRGFISLGDDCLIASNVKFVDHDHGVALDQPMRLQPDIQDDIEIGNNVWIGASAIVLKGVRISDGAIIAAGAVLNKSVGRNEIWAGVPARKIRSREK